MTTSKQVVGKCKGNIRVACANDIAMFKKANSLFNIDESILQSIIKSNSALVVETDDGNGCAAGVLNLAEDGTTMYRCILIDGDKDMVFSLLTAMNSRFNTVLMSTECMERCGLDHTSSDKWHKCTAIVDTMFTYQEGVGARSAMNLSKEHLQLLEKVDDAYVTQTLHTEELKFYSDDKTDKVIEIEKLLTRHCEGVYSFPFLSSMLCKRILAVEKTREYKPNPQEDVCVQMPEIVLDVGSEEYTTCSKAFSGSIVPLVDVMYYKDITSINSIQLAKYNKDSTANGNWHCDKSSDVTVVVALTDDYSGGGTAIKLDGSSEVVVVPPLPIGHALLFRGSVVKHKGLKVTEGDRKLLVFWTV